MVDKNLDHWIAGDQCFVTGGKGYGVNALGDTVCVGDEADILSRLATGALSFIPSKSTRSGIKDESSSKIPKTKRGG